jgi:plastocyanin
MNATTMHALPTGTAARATRRGLVVGLVAAIALSLAACGGSGASGALGFESPPASLDPASPRLAAVNIAFDQATLTVPAGKPFVLVFENRDGAQHNVSIYANVALERQQFKGVLFGGPATRWYPVPALAAGTYVFACDLHANMRGVLEAR